MSQGPYTGPPQSSGGGGGTVLIIVLVVLGVLGVVCIGICGLGFLGLRWTAENAPKMAESAAKGFGDIMMATLLQAQAAASVQANAEVREKLGEPLNFSSPNAEQMDLSAGKTTFDFDVTGPKGKGKVHVEGHREGDTWKIKTLQVKTADGATIDIDPSATFPTPDFPHPTPGIPDPLTPEESTP